MCDKKYFVFYDPRQADLFTSWITQVPYSSQVVILELDKNAPELYRQQFRCVTYEHFLTQRDFDCIDEVALRLAQSWYRTGEGDFSLDSTGISLGRVVEYEAMIQFVMVIKHLTLINAIRAKEGAVIFVCFDYHSSIGQALRTIESTDSLCVEWQVEEIEPPKYCPIMFSSNRSIKSLARLALQSLLVLFSRLYHLLNSRRLPMQRCRVLFYSSFGQYLPYLKGIVASGFAETFVYDPSVTTWHEIVKLDVHLILERPSVPKFARARSTWQQRWALLQATLAFIESFDYQGYSLWPIMRPFLESLFLSRFPELEILSINFANMLARYQLDLVVVPQDVKGTPRLLVLAAQSLGIPTLVTEHGIIANYEHRVLPLADKIAVWGKSDIDFYLRRGYERERLVVIGQPVLERLVRVTPHKPECSGSLHLAVDPDKPVILFAAQPYVPISARNSPVEIVSLLQMVIDACRGKADWQLVIKLHPAMDGHEVSSIDTGGANLQVVRSGNIYDLISMSDIVVTWSSTAGLEALVMGKQLIVIQVSGKEDYVPYVSSGAALGATSASALAQAIETVLSGADMTSQRRHCVEAFIRAHVEFIYEGGAVDRFVNLVKQLGGC